MGRKGNTSNVTSSSGGAKVLHSLEEGVNRYRFQSFSNRVAHIDIDVSHRLGILEDDGPCDEGSSLFLEHIAQLAEIDLTADYKAFKRDVYSLVGSLALVLKNRELIIDQLLKHLVVPNSMALKTLLTLLTVLARDLQTDFVPRFADTITAIATVLEHNIEVETIEQVFTTLCFLLKILRKPLQAQMGKVYKSLRLLLHHRRKIVNAFAAESTAYLFRTLGAKRFTKAMSTILADLDRAEDSESSCRTLSVIVFEMVKGVQEGFHSKMEMTLQLLLDQLPSRADGICGLMLQEVIDQMVSHCNRDAAARLQSVLIGSLSGLLTDEASHAAVPRMLKLMAQLALEGAGSLLSDNGRGLALSLGHVLDNKKLIVMEEVPTAAADLCAALFEAAEAQAAGDPVVQSLGPRVCTALVHSKTNGVESLLELCVRLSPLASYRSAMLPVVVQLCGLASAHEPTLIAHFWVSQQMSSYGVPKAVGTQLASGFEAGLKQQLAEISTELEQDAALDKPLPLAAVFHKMLPILDAVAAVKLKCPSLTSTLLEVLEQVTSMLEGAAAQTQPQLLLLFSSALEAACIVAPKAQLPEAAAIFSLVQDHTGSAPLLNAAATFASVVGLTQISKSLCQSLQTSMIDVVQQERRAVLRCAALRILSVLDEHNSLWQATLKLTEITPTLAASRALRIDILNLPADNVEQMSMCALSLLHVRASFLWSAVDELLTATARKGDKQSESLWTALLASMRLAAKNTDQELLDMQQQALLADNVDDDESKKEDLLADYWQHRCEPGGKPTDAALMHSRLYKLLQLVSELVERRSRQWIDLFFSLMDSTHCLSLRGLTVNDTQLAGRKLVKQRVVDMMGLIGTFSQPSVLMQSQQVYDVLCQLCSQSDRQLQENALKGVLQWKKPALAPYGKSLLQLIEKSAKTKDVMVAFSLDPTTSTIAKPHRPELLQMMSRLALGRLFDRTKQRGSGKDSSSSRRAMWLTYLGHAPADESKPFFDLLLDPFESSTNGTAHLVQFMGFLHLLANMLNTMRNHVRIRLPRLIAVLATTLERNELDKDGVHSEIEVMSKPGSRSADFASCQAEALNRVADLFEAFSSEPEQFKSLMAPLTPLFSQLSDTTAAHRPRVMKLASLIACKPPLLLLFKDNDMLWDGVVKCIGVVAKGMTVQLRVAAVTALKALIRHHKSEDQELAAAAKAIVKSRISLLLEMLHQMVTEAKKAAAVQNELDLLSELAVYAENNDQAESLCGLLLKFLRIDKKMRPAPKLKVLTILNKLFPLAANMLCNDHLSFLSSQFGGSSGGRLCRTALVQLMDQMASKQPELKEAAAILQNLNAFSLDTGEILDAGATADDEFDYDVRAAAVAPLVEGGVLLLGKVGALPVLWQLLHDMNEDELSIRNVSARAVEAFVRAASTEPWVLEHVRSVVHPAARRGLHHRKESQRAAFVQLLGAVVMAHPQDHPALADLASEDLEKDFFMNLCHLQVHRRSRALITLTKALHKTEHPWPQSVLTNVLMPIIMGFITGAHSKKAETEALLQRAGKNDEHNTTAMAIRALGATAFRMEWRLYHKTLTNLLKMIGSRPDLEKLLVRGVTEMLENFHFEIGEEASQSLTEHAETAVATIETQQDLALEADEKGEVEDEAEDLDTVVFATESQRKLVISEPEPADEEGAEAAPAEGEEEEEEEEEEGDGEEEEEEEKEVTMGQRIQAVLLTSILPMLQNYMKSKSSFEIHKVHVAVAAVQICKMLPASVRQAALPRIVIPLCGQLKSRLQDVRDGGRQAMVKCIGVLGPGYFGYFLSQMQFALRRGFEVHVLGYTVHSLLVEMLKKGQPMSAEVGDLDYSIEPLVEVLCNDVLGEVAKEKNIQAIAQKGKEMSGTKSFDSFELLGRAIGFPDTVSAVLQPLITALDESERLALVKRVHEALSRFGAGLNQNPQFVVQPALEFMTGLLNEHQPRQRSTNDKTVNVEEPKTKRQRVELVPIDARRTSTTMSNLQKHGHVLIDFSLGLLLTGLKHKKYGAECLEPLNTLFELLTSLLKVSSSDTTTTLLLKCAERMIQMKLPLPALKTHSAHFAKEVLHLLESAGAELGLVVKAAFRLVASLSRELADFKFDVEQLRVMLRLASVNMDDPERQSVCFGIIKGVIMHKVVISEIYDVMEEVANLSVQANFDTSRKSCRELFIHFLAHYPMNAKRLQRHIEFMLSHLSYEHTTGRLSALQLVHQLVTHFPVVLVCEHSQLIFLPLVLRLVNDEEPLCCKAAAAAIQALLKRLDHNSQKSLIDLCLKWFSGSKVALQAAAAQVLGLLKELGTNVVDSKLIDAAVLPVVQFVASQPADPDSQLELDPQGWRVIYSALVALEKSSKGQEDLLSDSFEEAAVWPAVNELLLHNHCWVRSAACRLLGKKLSDIGSPTEFWVSSKGWLADTDVLRRVANRLCNQWTSEHLDQQLGDQVAKNIVWIATAYLAAPSSDDAPEAEEKAEENPEEAEDAVEDTGASAGWLFRRLAYLGRTKGLIKRRCVFQCLAALCVKLPLEEVQANLIRIVGPLFRVSTQREVGWESSQLEDLAIEVLALVEQTVGTNEFTEAYNHVRNHLNENKKKRKSEVALEAITNPAKFAHMKVVKSAKKKRHAKNKKQREYEER